MKNTIVALALIICASGCAISSEVRTVDDRARVIVEGAPADAMLYVNGLVMGKASDYSQKEGALALESGTHEIEVKNGNQTFFSERVFLGPGNLKTIKTSAGRDTQ